MWKSNTYCSGLAQELSKWGERFSESSMPNQKIFEAYFVDGQNLADQNLLVKLAGEAGLSKKKLPKSLKIVLTKKQLTLIG